MIHKHDSQQMVHKNYSQKLFIKMTRTIVSQNQMYKNMFHKNDSQK